jgi:hypothetical protein
MYTTERRNFDVLRGSTFDPVFAFISGGLAVNLGGWSTRFVVGDLFALVDGQGIQADENLGLVSATLTAAQTAGAPLGASHFYLEATDPAGEVGYPLAGELIFADP